jgi:hypothetical protein
MITSFIGALVALKLAGQYDQATWYEVSALIMVGLVIEMSLIIFKSSAKVALERLK